MLPFNFVRRLQSARPAALRMTAFVILQLRDHSAAKAAGIASTLSRFLGCRALYPLAKLVDHAIRG